jgi:hypothetical protein
MKYKEFMHSLSQNTPPIMDDILTCLWYDAKGNWEKAHAIADGKHSIDHYRIHAYLHRKEGDPWNAKYWYQKAGEVMPHVSLENEWNFLVEKYTFT